jgi:hypothetical protein
VRQLGEWSGVDREFFLALLEPQEQLPREQQPEQVRAGLKCLRAPQEQPVPPSMGEQEEKADLELFPVQNVAQSPISALEENHSTGEILPVVTQGESQLVSV